MIIQHIKTGRKYNTTAEAWAKIQGRGDGHLYAVIEAEIPKEIKAARAKQPPGIEHNEGSNDTSTSEDSRADN